MEIYATEAIYSVLTLICFLRMLFLFEKEGWDSTNTLIVTAAQINVMGHENSL